MSIRKLSNLTLLKQGSFLHQIFKDMLSFYFCKEKLYIVVFFRYFNMYF